MQTSYATDPPFGRIGMLADARILKHTASRLASGTVKAGYGVFRVPGFGQPGSRLGDPGQVWQNPVPAQAVDVDAFVTTHASVDAGVVLVAADFNGVQGSAILYPARKVTVILDSHANWDAATGGLTVVYYNHLGVLTTEVFDVADLGAATFTTAGYARQLVSVTFTAAAASGTGGSFTVGVAALDATVDLTDFVGVAVYDSSVESPAYLQGDLVTAEYWDTATVPVLQKGAVWVTTEDACVAGGAVYVRVTASGANTQLGAFRSDADTAAAVVITGAKWGRDSSAGGLNILELF